MVPQPVRPLSLPAVPVVQPSATVLLHTPLTGPDEQVWKVKEPLRTPLMQVRVSLMLAQLAEVAAE